MPFQPIFTATPAIISPMKAVTTASILPCPYGWSASAGDTQNRTPSTSAASVTRSERECTASAKSACDANAMPPANFAPAINRLTAAPANATRRTPATFSRALSFGTVFTTDVIIPYT